MSTVKGTELWLLWKRANEHVRSAVIADVTAGSDVSEAELTVLVQLSDAGGRLRQNALVAATGWDRTRLSHLLSRMEARHLVSREKLRNGVDVALELRGKDTIDQAQPRLAGAVQEHLLGKLDQGEQQLLGEILDKLIS